MTSPDRPVSPKADPRVNAIAHALSAWTRDEASLPQAMWMPCERGAERVVAAVDAAQRKAGADPRVEIVRKRLITEVAGRMGSWYPKVAEAILCDLDAAVDAAQRKAKADPREVVRMVLQRSGPSPDAFFAELARFGFGVTAVDAVSPPPDLHTAADQIEDVAERMHVRRAIECLLRSLPSVLRGPEPEAVEADKPKPVDPGVLRERVAEAMFDLYERRAPETYVRRLWAEVNPTMREEFLEEADAAIAAGAGTGQQDG